MRTDLLAGKKFPACKTCWDQETYGVYSKRLGEIDRMGPIFDELDARRITQEDGEISEDTPIYAIDIRFGNNCNLACRMCWPGDSTLWYSDFVQLRNTNKFTIDEVSVEIEKNPSNKWQLSDKKLFSWHNESRFWNQLESHAKTLRHIYMAGGEPLIAEKHYNFLQLLIDRSIAPLVTLEYATNFTVLPEKAIALWPHFKLVNLGISIDGTSKVNDYVRYPSKWDNVLKNFDKLESYPSDNLVCYVNSTLSALNAHKCLDLLKWYLERKKSGRRYPKNICAHTVVSPPKLSPLVLPHEIRSRLLSDFQSLQKSEEAAQESDRDILYSFEQYESNTTMIASGDPSPLLPEFLKETTKLDKIREESWKNLFSKEDVDLIESHLMSDAQI